MDISKDAKVADFLKEVTKEAGVIPGVPDGTGPYGRGRGPGRGRGDGTGLGRSRRPGRGVPLTDEERLRRHKIRFPDSDVKTVEDLPPRGTGRGLGSEPKEVNMEAVKKEAIDVEDVNDPDYVDPSNKEPVYAIRCFLNGERKYTHELTKEEAEVFYNTAEKLKEYLKEEYLNKNKEAKD